MIITDKCKAKNKLGLLIELTRIDENTATLLDENYYDTIEIIENAEINLEYLGIELELKRNPEKNYGCISLPFFDELTTLREALYDEIENNDRIIHFNREYGFENGFIYKKEGLIL